LDRVNSKGLGKSRGYAFVNFTEHKHALEALRMANNNPDLFGENKRLIIEFSLENKAALMAKQKRMENIQKFKTPHSASQPGGRPMNRGKSAQAKPVIATVAAPEGTKPLTAQGKGKGKGMPSHFGPKIRHKPRPVQTQKKQNKYKNLSQNNVQNNVQQPQKRPAETLDKRPNKRGKKNPEKKDSFDALVAKYKGAMGNSQKRGTWCQWASSTVISPVKIAI